MAFFDNILKTPKLKSDRDALVNKGLRDKSAKVDATLKKLETLNQAMGDDPVAKKLARDSMKADSAKKKRLEGLSKNPLK